MEKSVILKIRDIKKQFKKKIVLSDINLDIYQTEIFGLIGISGIGKSTFLQTIIGILRPEEGDIEFRPEHLLSMNKNSVPFKSVYCERKAVKHLFGFASQTPSFYPDLTVEENLKYFGSLYDLSKDTLKSNIETSLSLISLNDEKKILAKNLSGGMKKRLDIACAIVHDPDILILDEPTSDLDPVLRSQMWDLIRKINSTGTTIIVASHFLDEIENYCDRVGIIHNGKMVDYGTISEIVRKYFNYDEIHIETVPGRYKQLIQSFKKEKDIISIESKGHKLILYCSKAESVIKTVVSILQTHKESMLDINIEKPTLGKVFEIIIDQYTSGKIK